DKLDRLGMEGVRALLGEGRKDESGDFTKGAELSPEQATTVLDTLSINIAELTAGLPDISGIPAGAKDSGSLSDGLLELSQISDLCRAAGYGDDRIRIDPSVVRGLEYYTGPVFEAELTFPV